MNHEAYMRVAMDEAQLSFDSGSAPFSVVVVDAHGQIVWRDHDRVRELTDPTAHGEVNAIRYLCKKLGTLSLSEYTFYTSSEPCPTCLTCCIKANVRKIYYGAETESSASLPIKAAELAKLSKVNPIEVYGGILGEECLAQRERLLKQLHNS